jgi:ABC-type amino acid transport system permease subunit
MGYDFDFSVIWQYRSLFLQGALMTIRITGVATALGLLVGILMAGLQLIRFRPLSDAYPGLYRGHPQYAGSGTAFLLLFWLADREYFLAGLAGSDHRADDKYRRVRH